MYCNNCGKKLAKHAVFCGNCGNIISKSSELNSSNNEVIVNEEKKAKNKWIQIMILGIVVILSSVFLVCYINIIKPKMAFNKLPELSTIERQMNSALNMMLDSDSRYEVSDFEISDVEEENYDKIFSCDAMNGNVRIYGQAKDGHIIQIQTIVMLETDGIDLSEDAVAMLMELSIFQLSLFDNDVNKLSDYTRVINDMEELENHDKYGYAGRYVKNDIETTIDGFVTGTGMAIFGNVRYLPEFGEGFFDENLYEE